jgi:nucleoredoxin
MRHVRFFIFLLFVILTAGAGQLPLTTKEISLMLRSGYSSSAVIQELSTRHFADRLDSPNEKALVQAGASAELIEALRSGAYSLSAEQTGIARQQMADQAKRNAAEAARIRANNNMTNQDRLARPHPTTFAIQGDNTIYQQVKDDLVCWRSGGMAHFDDEALADKKLIGLYFSAHWCGPCRKFTPELVDYYNRVAPQHPELEVIFVSSDRSPAEMEMYMREMSMPWPAIEYHKLPQKGAIAKYAGSGIPCLVVVDQTGKVVSDSYAGQQYLGPKKVLSDLDAIFAHGSVAQTH